MQDQKQERKVDEMKRFKNMFYAVALMTLFQVFSGMAWGQLYWSGDGASAGGAGTWDTSNAHFGAAAVGPFDIVWDNTANAGDIAKFSSSGGVVVIQAGGITAKEVEINTTGCSFSGGTLTLGSAGVDHNAGDTVTFNNALNISVNQPWSVYSANVIDVAGPLSGTGKITLGGGGPSATIILRGDNSAWSGGIETGKPVQLGHDSALGTGPFSMGIGEVSAIDGPHTFSAPLYKWVPNSDATLTFGGANRMEFTGTFTIGAGINRRYVEFQITNTEETEFSGDIVQIEGDEIRDVVKSGTGVLIFSGDNTYFGETRVSEGELWVNGTTSGQDDYIVNTGGRLGGSGTLGLLPGSTGIVQTAGCILPGSGTNTVGTLTVNGDFDFRDGAIYAWEYQNGAGDLVDVNGELTLPSAATVTVSQVSGSLPATPTLFTADTLVGATDLSAWILTGLPEATVAIQGNSVVLKTASSGTVIYIQ